MNRIQNLCTAATLAVIAQPSIAGIELGARLGEPLSVTLVEALGGVLPAGIGGAAGITALALIIGAQVIKRKK
jgi:hypothetical protein